MLVGGLGSAKNLWLLERAYGLDVILNNIIGEYGDKACPQSFQCAKLVLKLRIGPGNASIHGCTTDTMFVLHVYLL